MKDTLRRRTLRVEQVLLDKLAYAAEYEGRTKNRKIEQLIKNASPNLSASTARSFYPGIDRPKTQEKH